MDTLSQAPDKEVDWRSATGNSVIVANRRHPTRDMRLAYLSPANLRHPRAAPRDVWRERADRLFIETTAADRQYRPVSQGVVTLKDYSSQAAILAKRELLSPTSRQVPDDTQAEHGRRAERSDILKLPRQAATLTKTRTLVSHFKTNPRLYR